MSIRKECSVRKTKCTYAIDGGYGIVMKIVNGTISQFCEEVKGKKLVCIGAGKMLRSFVEAYEEKQILSMIDYIADNDGKKVGTEWRYKEYSFPVICVEQLKQMKNVIILISCADVMPIVKQLNAYEQMQNTICYFVGYIRSETNRCEEENRWYPNNYKLTEKPLIPKKLHYCWFGGKKIPDRNLMWMESWKKYCPDYEIIRWDESNYDVTKNQYMYEAYQAQKWSFVSDYARLDIVYNEGGIYLDTDVEVIRSIDDLLYQKAFMGVESSRLINLGLGFGSLIHNPIIKELRDIYEKRKFIKDDGSYDLTAIPTLQKDIFQKKGYINDGNYQVIDDVTIYPEKVLSAKCNWTGRIMPTKNTFMIHHYDGSWTSKEWHASIKEAQELFQDLFG